MPVLISLEKCGKFRSKFHTCDEWVELMLCDCCRKPNWPREWRFFFPFWMMDDAKIWPQIWHSICRPLESSNSLYRSGPSGRRGNRPPHSLWLGTEKGQRKFWERRISMICLCSKYVKNCNIFGQILNIWVKLILKKNFKFFFQCLALPKDPQSFGSQNLRCPFSVSQYYRRRRLWIVRF